MQEEKTKLEESLEEVCEDNAALYIVLAVSWLLCTLAHQLSLLECCMVVPIGVAALATEEMLQCTITEASGPWLRLLLQAKSAREALDKQLSLSQAEARSLARQLRETSQQLALLQEDHAATEAVLARLKDERQQLLVVRSVCRLDVALSMPCAWLQTLAREFSLPCCLWCVGHTSVCHWWPASFCAMAAGCSNELLYA
jgi:hypothetical protein